MSTPEREVDHQVDAYVDGELSSEDRGRFESRLRDDPALRSRVGQRRSAASALRAYDRILEEPIPQRISSVFGNPRAGRGRWPAMAATLVLGIGIGWVAAMQTAPDPDVRRALPREAALVHALYVKERRHAVEVPASDAQHLNQWLSARLAHPVTAPDLRGLGFDFVGGRLLSDAGQPAAHYMYQDADGRRITLFVRVHGLPEESGAPRHVRQGNLGVTYWSEGSLAFAWTGEVDEATLAAIAAETRGRPEG